MSEEGRTEKKLATVSYKFSFLLCPDEGKYHWLKNDALPINFDSWYSFPTRHKINVCHTFRNMMLKEIRKIMITPFSGEKHDHSLLL